MSEFPCVLFPIGVLRSSCFSSNDMVKSNLHEHVQTANQTHLLHSSRVLVFAINIEAWHGVHTITMKSVHTQQQWRFIVENTVNWNFYFIWFMFQVHNDSKIMQKTWAGEKSNNKQIPHFLLNEMEPINGF